MAITWRNSEQFAKQLEAIKEEKEEQTTTKAIEYAVSNILRVEKELFKAQNLITEYKTQIQEIQFYLIERDKYDKKIKEWL